jgi:negative regulator of sigma-B (phosphoserine phosphatase)
MSKDPHNKRSIIEWAAAGQPLGARGEGSESGDVQVVAPFPEGILVGVIDGLGHGSEAAQAARMAAQILTAYAGEPVQGLIERCHGKLRDTRGAVMSLAAFNGAESLITWIGVGNVEGVLLRADLMVDSRYEAISARGGIVGYQLPPLRPTTVSVARGDTLIMATDGIRSGFTVGVNLRHDPRDIAESILTRHSKGSDDSLVLVARYLGGTCERLTP